MSRVLTILKTGISCAIIIFIMQALTYWFFAERFEEYYKYTPFFIVLLKIGIINLIIYLFFSFVIFAVFGHIPGNFLSRSFLLMAFFVVFKTTPVVLNLFFASAVNLSFVLIFLTMNVISDVISAFIFTGMFTETVKIFEANSEKKDVNKNKGEKV